MGHKSKEEAREYARQYRLAVKSGKLIPVPASEKRRNNTIECDTCGKAFYRPAANRCRISDRKYCSRECMAKAFIGKTSRKKHQHNKVKCTQCQTNLVRPDWWVKQQENVFCNRSCFGAWKAENWCGENNPCWRGGKFLYYGPNWIRQSREARKRDERKCKFCEVHEGELYRSLDVHHIKPFRFFLASDYKSANKLANLVSLCASCHKFLEYFSKDGTVNSWDELRVKAIATTKGRSIIKQSTAFA
jgi:5-methylcytosine-specific restriction endonuclease McrA